jgi:uncharacterized membrane protein YhaH (DUF805 family)
VTHPLPIPRPADFADFRTRTRRREYWWLVAYAFLAFGAADIAGGLFGLPLASVAAALLAVPVAAATVRRLRDAGRSPWWPLVLLVPLVGPFALAALLAARTAPEPLMRRPLAPMSMCGIRPDGGF